MRTNEYNPGFTRQPSLSPSHTAASAHDEMFNSPSPRMNEARTNSAQDSYERSTPPVALPLDPLSSRPLKDPVIAPDGITYSRDVLLTRLKSDRQSLPSKLWDIQERDLFVDRSMARRLELLSTVGTLDGHLDDFNCPITLCPCRQPAVASDGYTYNFPELKRVFITSGISPMTREPLRPFAYRNKALLQLTNPPKKEDVEVVPPFRTAETNVLQSPVVLAFAFAGGIATMLAGEYYMGYILSNTSSLGVWGLIQCGVFGGWYGGLTGRIADAAYRWYCSRNG